MKQTWLLTMGGLGAGLMTAAASAQSFTWINGYSNTAAMALSRDGNTAVGSACCNSHQQSMGFVWGPASGTTFYNVNGSSLQYVYVLGVSGTGSTLVGSSSEGQYRSAVKWNRATGVMSYLGRMPGANTGLDDSSANAISADGSIIVGGTFLTAGRRAFRWTQSGAFADLGLLPGTTAANANAVTPDGSVIVGSCSNASYQATAFRWTAAGGMQSLGTLPGATQSEAYAVNTDGSVIVGRARFGSTSMAFRWDAEQGMQPLGLLPGNTNSVATTVNGDGTLVGGYCHAADTLPTAHRGFIWQYELGMTDIEPYLIARGVPVHGPSGGFPTDVNAMSADGLAMCGSGNVSGIGRAWYAVIPACGSADFNNDGDIGTDQDIEAFFRCLGGNCCAACWYRGADFNGDGDIGTDADIESFFRVLAGDHC